MTLSRNSQKTACNQAGERDDIAPDYEIIAAVPVQIICWLPTLSAGNSSA